MAEVPPLRALLPSFIALCLLPLVPAPALASPSFIATNAVYVDAAGAPHAAAFQYEGPCDGLGSATLRLLDTGAVLASPVQSQTVGGFCGAVLACMDCPPVPKAAAWELTGLGVVLAGGGPGYYDAYSDHSLGYSLSGQYLGGVLTAWGLPTVVTGQTAGPVCQEPRVDTWAAGVAWRGCYHVDGYACTDPRWFGGHGLLGGGVCEGATSFTLPPEASASAPAVEDVCFLEIVGPDLLLRTCLDPTNPDCLVYTDRWGKEGESMGRTCQLP